MNKLRILLSLFILLIGFQLVLGQNKPFPQALNFPNCIKPNNVTQAAMNTSVTSYYTYWKGKYLKNNLTSLPGGYYVLGDITGSADGYNPLGSSEGQGYGMLITVLMAGYDANAQTIFDGLFKTARAFKSSNNSNLMGWVVADAASAQGHFDSATDGDMDIAYSLILAHYQWGSNGAINYLNEAKNMITNGLKASYVTNGNRLNLGDWDSKTSTDTRPSDWMLSHMKAFKDVTGDVTWDNVSTTTYGMINSLQTNYSSTTGLMPDFATGNPVKPAAPNFLESANDGDYYYNACRTPLRFVLDFAHYGNANGKTAVNKIVTWAKTKTGGTPTNFRAGYTLAGNDINGNNYASAVFVAPIVAASTCDAAHQAFLNSGWSSIISMKEGYFEDTYNMLCMLYITGNWWIPQNTLGQSPTVSITSPANNATFTAPASITINATAADADGTISKVEFYNGASLLGTDNTSPYSYSWTNVAVGTYSITAKATDNAGNATTSAAVTVVVSVPEAPYGGTRAAIPGTVQAENYDLGGQGVAYNDVTSANEGGAYRTDAVDIEAIAAGGFNVGYIQAGEWMKYMVNVATTGNYKIEAYVASTTAGNSFTLDLDGTSIGTINVPNTGGWQTWQVVTIDNVSLTAGDKVLKFNATTANFNFDRVVFSLVSNSLPTVSITAPINNATYTAPASVTIYATATDADGTISKVDFYNGTTLLNSDNTSPYSYSWTGVAAGTYPITAKATDNSGNVTTSSIINIVVNGTNNSNFKVIGYYPTWMNYPNGINNIDLSRVTHVNIAFANPNASGVLVPSGGTNADVTTMVNACHAKGVKVFMSIGGAGASGSRYQTLITSNQSTFINNIVNYATTYNLDGIDVDIEGNVLDGTILTASQYEGFITALGIALHAQNKLMSAALANWFAQYVTNTAASKFDWINIMSYDEYGPWSGPGQHSPYSKAVSDFQYWNTTKAVPASKLTIGVPFYGYGWGTLTPADNDEISYCTIVNTYPGAENKDQIGSGNDVIYYNGIPTIKQKSAYALQNAGGIMIWEIAEDCNDSKSLLLAIDQVIHPPVTNKLPNVSITSPLNNTSFTVPASLTVNATATDEDGTITKVEFYNGTTLLNSDNTAPYSYNWTGVNAGTYTLTAKAYDNSGASATSATISVTVAPPGINQYTINKILTPVTVDGVLNEQDWVNAPFTENLLNMDGSAATLSTKAKMLWDDTHLYFAFIIQDNSIWSTLTAKDAQLWTQDVLEVLIDKDGDGVNYNEIGFAPNGTIYDLLMDKPYSAGGTGTTSWDINGLTVKSTVTGTMNTATGGVQWLVEVALPFSGIPATPATFGKPNAGDVWRLNLARDDHNYNDAASEKLYTWTYTDGISNHVPSRFGKVTFGAAPNVPPSVSITAPTNNSTFTAPASVTINTTANDSDGSISKVELYNGTTLLNSDNSSPFSYSWTGLAAGTYTITAKAYDNLNASTTSSAITIVVNNPNVAPTVSITAPSNNATFTAPASVTINATANDSDGSIAKVEFYNGTTLLNSDNSSPYSYSWTGVSAGTYTITAKAYDNLNLSTTSTAITIVVNNPNVAPTVSITAPTNNATFTAPASVTINATANDTDGSISKVEFYNGTSLLGSDNTTPYSYSWTGIATGTYTITAKAYDNLNLSTTSTAITIVVNSPNVAPTVSITAPTNNATFTAPASVTINATANDSDGSIAKVEFYNGTTLLNSDNSSPYSYSWTGVTAGTYTITAKAYDNLNLSTTSTAITIVVNNPNLAPTVSITAPTNNATYTAPASVTINATANDSDGSIAKVEFYNGTTLLNSDNTSPYSYSWTGVSAGTYAITAKAYDNLNLITTSTAITIVVNNQNVAPTVSITSPTNSAMFTAPASFIINAEANDSDGSISKVEFYYGTTLLGTDNSFPYSYSSTNVAAGTYAFTAKAYDNLNATTSSSAITIIVSNPNSNPIVTITSSANSSVEEGTSVTITATANDPDGTITKMEIFDGDTKIGELSSGPYVFTLSDLAVGSHSITVVATDNGGGKTTSSAIDLNVTEVTGLSESMSNDIQLNNYPNPFNYSTDIEVTIIKAGQSKVIVYDNYGRELRILADEYLNPGTYTFRIEGDFKPGTYVCKVICDNQFKNLKIVKQ